MSNPTQDTKRPTTRVMAAVQAAHGTPSTLPRYGVGLLLLLVGVGLFVYHIVSHAEAMGPLELRVTIGCGVVGLAIIPGIAEAVLATGQGAIGLYKSFKNPQPPTP